MKPMTRSSNRAGLAVVLSLQLAAVGLVAGNAYAGTWECTNVDGPDSTNSDHTTYKAFGSTSAVLNAGLAQPIYTRQDGTAGTTFLFTGDDFNYATSTCSNNTDPFFLGEIDGPDSDGSMAAGAAVMDSTGDITWTAYLDVDGNVFAGKSGFEGGPEPGSVVVTSDPDVEMPQGTPALAIFGSKTYVFFTVEESDGVIDVRFVDSTNGTTWSGNDVAGFGKQPTAAVLGTHLWMFSRDDTDQCLLASATTDGTTWGTLSPCLDGAGGSNGQTTNDVGSFPTAIVDTSGGGSVLRVFYQDNTAGALRVSSLSGSTWTAEVVDSSVVMDSPPAAVIHGGTVHVFYVDSTNHLIKHSWRTGSGSDWESPQTIDGGSSNLCGSAHHGTSHHLAGPISAVERPGCNGGVSTPHVFYADTAAFDLREAYVQD